MFFVCLFVCFLFVCWLVVVVVVVVLSVCCWLLFLEFHNVLNFLASRKDSLSEKDAVLNDLRERRDEAGQNMGFNVV
jgi:hypothetical protein